MCFSMLLLLEDHACVSHSHQLDTPLYASVLPLLQWFVSVLLMHPIEPQIWSLFKPMEIASWHANR